MQEGRIIDPPKIFACQLQEDRIMDLIAEHNILSLLIRNLSLYHSIYSQRYKNYFLITKIIFSSSATSLSTTPSTHEGTKIIFSLQKLFSPHPQPLSLPLHLLTKVQNNPRKKNQKKQRCHNPLSLPTHTENKKNDCVTKLCLCHAI